MADEKQRATENMVHAATELGIAIVDELAMKALVSYPNMSLIQFRHVMKQSKQEVQASVTIEAGTDASE